MSIKIPPDLRVSDIARVSPISIIKVFYGPQATSTIKAALGGIDGARRKEMIKRAKRIGIRMMFELRDSSQLYDMKEIRRALKKAAKFSRHLRKLAEEFKPEGLSALLIYLLDDEELRQRRNKSLERGDSGREFAWQSAGIIGLAQPTFTALIPYLERAEKRLDKTLADLEERKSKSEKKSKKGPPTRSAYQRAVDALYDLWEEFGQPAKPSGGQFSHFVRAVLLPVSPQNKKSFAGQINETSKSIHKKPPTI